MDIHEAIAILEEMYGGIDGEAEALDREDSELAFEARKDRRALAVALENLYQLANECDA